MQTITGNELDIDTCIDFLTGAARYMSELHKLKLRQLLDSSVGRVGYSVGSPGSSAGRAAISSGNSSSSMGIDLLAEIQEQLMIVKSLRTSLSGSTDPRELKDMVQASTALFSSLTKLRGEVLRQERARKIEIAVVEAVKTLPEATKNLFFATLEVELGRVGA